MDKLLCRHAAGILYIRVELVKKPPPVQTHGHEKKEQKVTKMFPKLDS